MCSKSKRNRIRKRNEMLPGRKGGTERGERKWDAKSLRLVWNVGMRSPDLKSQARILNQALRLPAMPAPLRVAHPDLVHADQAR